MELYDIVSVNNNLPSTIFFITFGGNNLFQKYEFIFIFILSIEKIIVK